MSLTTGKYLNCWRDNVHEMQCFITSVTHFESNMCIQKSKKNPISFQMRSTILLLQNKLSKPQRFHTDSKQPGTD